MNHPPIHFTDRAATRTFEVGLDPGEVVAALESEHFAQPATEYGRFVHYLKVSGVRAKVVTGPLDGDPEVTAILDLALLERIIAYNPNAVAYDPNA